MCCIIQTAAEISPQKRQRFIKPLSESIRSVAVVVSPTIGQATEIESAGFDMIQVHGKVDEAFLNQIHLPVFRAVNINEENICLEEHSKVTGYVLMVKNLAVGKRLTGQGSVKSA